MNARLVQDINPGSRGSSIDEITNVNGIAYFAAFNGDNYGLWKSNGTSSETVLLQSFEQEPDEDSEYVAVNENLFFTNFDNATGTELWIEENGTRVVQDIFENGSSNPEQLTPVGNKVYFLADSDEDEVNELWQSDGTNANTESVLNTEVSNLTDMNGTLYFTQDESPGELWNVNNTSGEAELILETTGSDVIASLTDVEGTLYFIRNEYELWKLEDNSGTPEKVIEFDRSPDSAGIEQLTSVRNTLYFSFNNGAIGRELYQSNGETDNTGLVKDISPDMQDAGTTINLSSDLNQLTDVNGTLYFVADSNDNGQQELWSSNGTDETTQLLAEFDRDIIKPTDVNGIVHFAVGSSYRGQGEIWRSDGTKAGTVLASDVQSTNFYQSEVVNGDLYYSAYPARGNSFDTELWTLDNTPEVYSLFNSATESYLYTTDESKIDTLVNQQGYDSQGVAFSGADPLSGQPVYQFTDEATGGHLYTINEVEKDLIETTIPSFSSDGDVFFAYESEIEGTVPVYRFRDLTTEGYLFTSSATEREAWATSENFVSEGVGFHVFPDLNAIE